MKMHNCGIDPIMKMTTCRLTMEVRSAAASEDLTVDNFGRKREVMVAMETATGDCQVLLPGRISPF